MTEAFKVWRPSPSAIEVMRRCECAYGAKYVAKLPEAQGAKAALGDRCHHITGEDYLRDGKAPNRSEQFDITEIANGSPKTKTYYPGRIAQNIFHHLPPAGSVRDVEGNIGFTYKGITFNGRKDWGLPWLPGVQPPLLGDHKFTSSVAYVKAAETLHADVQKVIYQADLFLNPANEGCDEGVAQWTYGTFDAKDSRKVVLPLYRKDFQPLLDGLLPTVEHMARIISDRTDWTSLKPTGLTTLNDRGRNACEDTFGKPCAFRDHCTHGSKNATRGLPAIFGPVPGRSEPTTSNGVRQMGSSLLERLKVRSAAAAVANGNAAPALSAPDDAPTPPPAAPAVAAAVEPPQPTINPPGEACDMPKAEEPAAPVVAPETTEAKRGRGRPKKDAAPSAPTPLAGVKVIEETSAPERADGKHLILLIDVLVQKADTTGAFSEVLEASDLIAQANRHIATQFPEITNETGPHYMFHAFGKGRAMLATTLQAIVADLPAATVVAISTRSPEGADALQTLVEASAVVFRGVA